MFSQEHVITLYIYIIYYCSDQSFIYSPTDAQLSCLKNNIKSYIKPPPTCFGVTVTPSSETALFCAY